MMQSTSAHCRLTAYFLLLVLHRACLKSSQRKLRKRRYVDEMSLSILGKEKYKQEVTKKFHSSVIPTASPTNWWNSSLTWWRHRLLCHCCWGSLAPYLFIICLDYVLRTSIDQMKENSFTLKKTRSRRYPTETILKSDYTDDIALLSITPNQAESLLYCLEQAAVDTDLHVKEDNKEYMCFNKKIGHISTLTGGSLKLADKFMFFGSSFSSTENEINMWLAKAWSVIHRLSIIWESDLSDEIKRSFFQVAAVSILLYGFTKWTPTKRLEKKLDGNTPSYTEQILEATIRPPTSYL